MTGKRYIYYLLLAMILVLFAGCSNTRFLADNEILYTGKDHVILTDSGSYYTKEINRIVKSTTAYKPNNSIGGKRVLPPVGLWIYNYLKPKEGKERGGWLYRNLASEPVLISTVNPELRCRKIESELFNIGYFKADAYAERNIREKNQDKSTITYYVKPGMPYRYDSVTFAEPKENIDSLINKHQNELRIEPGDVFELDKIREGSQYLAEIAQNEGFYYFSPEDMEWKADTSGIPYRIDMTIGRKTEDKPESSGKYIIGKITVTIISEDQEIEAYRPVDTTGYDALEIVTDKDYIIKPSVISSNIYFRPGDYYSLEKYRQTITRLNNLGIFKFINVQFF